MLGTASPPQIFVVGAIEIAIEELGLGVSGDGAEQQYIRLIVTCLIADMRGVVIF